MSGVPRFVWALLLLCLCALLFPIAAQAAIEQHLFDPTISLTGDCSTEKADQVRDPWCPGPPGPSAAFEEPNIAIDSFGDMYVSSHGSEGTAGRVDVFSPEGQFIAELQVPGAHALAVDPKGNLYVNQVVAGGLHRVTLFRPTGTYDPVGGEIAYEAPGEVIIEDKNTGAPCSAESAIELVGLAVDPVTEHLFVGPGRGCVAEWSSAEEGPELLDPTIGSGVLTSAGRFIAVDATHNRLYVSDLKEQNNPFESLIQVFELQAPHAHLGTIDGHSTANGKFLALSGNDAIAVDEASGHLIVSDLRATPRVYEFGMGLGANEELLETYKYSGFKVGPWGLQVAVDNAPTSPNHRSIFVPTAPEGATNHTFAFRFSSEGAPMVQSPAASGITETEALPGASVNPNGAQTTYRVEYTAEPIGFEGAIVAAEGTLASGIAGVPVSASLAGLAPGTSYRFRVVAQNKIGSDEAEGSFRTYSTPQLGGPCPNQALRTGSSAALPDCRAYELVTPANTNGRIPRGAGGATQGGGTGLYFPTLQASPDGAKVSFRIEGGTIPGFEGSGSFNGDDYLARRGANGWSTELAGPSGTDALAPGPGGFSPDQEHSFWQGETDPISQPFNPFIRYPDGHSEPVGRGSLGVDSKVEAKLIGPNGSHTIFATLPAKAVQLEPDAPPAGTAAVYDRTADEVTHVVSLLPGDLTPAAGKNAEYVGASLDGTGVAFKLAKSNSTLYLRQDDEETYEIGEGLTYAGIAEGGGRIFYLKGGDLFAYDTATEAPIRFSEGGDTTPVNISPDGRTAYLVSPDVLTAGANPDGAHAQLNQENLYVSREGQIGFVGTVEEEDVKEPLAAGPILGLGQWVESLRESNQTGQPALETSRTTPDGGMLLFESRAALAGYDPAGHKEIYLYDSAAGTLSCLSCSPTGVPASGDASLQTVPQRAGLPSVLGLSDRMLNLRADGQRAFFQTPEALVAADTDGKQDVYEWEAQGLGSCTQPGGCLYLISSPSSERDEHLFAVSESGDDVFFLSGNLLAGGDTDTTASIYDARVGGGFPEAGASPACQGEGCRATTTPPPSLLSPTSAVLPKDGNVHHRSCGKGKHRVRRHGKERCVRRAAANQKASH